MHNCNQHESFVAIRNDCLYIFSVRLPEVSEKDRFVLKTRQLFNIIKTPLFATLWNCAGATIVYTIINSNT